MLRGSSHSKAERGAWISWIPLQQSPQLVPLISGTAKPSPGELWGLPGRTQGWQQWLRPQDRPPAGAGLAHRPWREKTPTSSEHSGISFPLYARKMPSCRCWLQTCGRTAQPSPAPRQAEPMGRVPRGLPCRGSPKSPSGSLSFPPTPALAHTKRCLGLSGRGGEGIPHRRNSRRARALQ